MTLLDGMIRHLVSIQPRSIRGLMIEDRQLRRKLNLGEAIQVTAGAAGEFGRAKLFQTVRLALEDRQPRTLSNARGASIIVSIDEGCVQFSFEGSAGDSTRVQVLDMMLLSPRNTDRVGAFHTLVDDTGPTGPDPERWRTILEKRALADDEFEELAAEVGDSVPVRMGKVRTVMLQPSISWRDIVPTSMRYYEQLCGPDPKRTDAEAYLTEKISTHRQTLIRRDFARGLDLCLVGALRDDLYPTPLIKDRSDDELWGVVRALTPPDDPFSALGLLDIAMARSNADERFRNLATETIDRLSERAFRQANNLDALAFMPAVISLTIGRFRQIDGMLDRSPYWRRLAAWTHAGLIVRCMAQLNFRLDTFTAWCESFRVREDLFIEIADARHSPMWDSNSLSAEFLRAEIVGRMAAISGRCRSTGVALDLCDSIDSVVHHFDETEVAVRRIMAGPLEGHLRPIDRPGKGALSDKNQTKLRKEVERRLWTRGWSRVGLAARFVPLGPELLASILEVIPDVEFGKTAQQRRRSFNNLAQVCAVAAAHRDGQLAQAIGARCVKQVSTETSAEDADRLLRVILLAAAAIQDDSEWAQWLDTTLRSFVARLPRGPRCVSASQSLSSLRKSVPGYRKIVSPAAALAELGE